MHFWCQTVSLTGYLIIITLHGRPIDFYSCLRQTPNDELKIAMKVMFKNKTSHRSRNFIRWLMNRGLRRQHWDKMEVLFESLKYRKSHLASYWESKRVKRNNIPLNQARKIFFSKLHTNVCRRQRYSLIRYLLIEALIFRFLTHKSNY